MSLNADRIHIALFGKRNAGKSSVINAMTNQELAIVSDVKGTTTDPVYKAMELLPLGPVVMIDTPGLDDEGELGEKRVKKAKEVLAKADIALVIMDATAGMTEFEEDMIRLIEDRKIPYLKVYNKMDLSNAQEWKEDKACFVSAKDKKGIWELKEEIGKLVPTDDDTLKIVGDLVCPNDFVILVVPIDSAAPKGRLILPQQQTIRDLLEAGAASIVVRETELEKTLEEIGKKPALVITDSQAFGKVSKIVPEDIKLTSFSILFARYKGDLEEEVRGVKALEHLEEGAKILIAEGCTHHRQCDDIGTVKIPRWLKQYTGKDFDIHTSSGNSFPEDLDTYDLVIHCGGCTLNRREMKNRIARVKDAGLSTDFNRPAFAIMNPELTYTLPKYQVGCGIVDIMMHTLDRYFTQTENNELTDEIAEGLLRTVIRNGAVAIKDSQDYNAMSEIMWAGSLSHNGITGLGAEKDFAVHQLGHELSAKFDIAHGASLSAVWGAWATYVYDAKPARFAQYARRVWNVEEADDVKAAQEGIRKTVTYFASLDMPTSFREAKEIGSKTDEEVKQMAHGCSYEGTRTIGSFKVCDENDIYEIYKLANK